MRRINKLSLLITLTINNFLVNTQNIGAIGYQNVIPTGKKDIADATNFPIQDLGGTGGLLTALIQTSIILASIGFFVYLIIGGIRWLTSGGDKAATQGARDSITHAATGLLIVLAAYGIARIVEIAFGLNIVSGGITFPKPK